MDENSPTLELQELEQKIEKAKSELQAREKEISEHWYERNNAIASIKEETKVIETERIRLEKMRDEASAKAAEYRKILWKIDQANKEQEKNMEEFKRLRDEAEDRRVAAQAEISSASYMSDIAKHLIFCFRQELVRYIQISGQEVKIQSLTDEHRRFIANDLLSQCSEMTPTSVTVSEEETAPNVEESAEEIQVDGIKYTDRPLEELRIIYEEKTGKKPFNGWNAEILISKITQS